MGHDTVSVDRASGFCVSQRLGSCSTLETAGCRIELLFKSTLSLHAADNVHVAFVFIACLFLHLLQLELKVGNTALGALPAEDSKPRFRLGRDESVLEVGLLGFESGKVPFHVLGPLRRTLESANDLL